LTAARRRRRWIRIPSPGSKLALVLLAAVLVGGGRKINAGKVATTYAASGVE
jgi:hypothetical protein